LAPSSDLHSSPTRRSSDLKYHTLHQFPFTVEWFAGGLVLNMNCHRGGIIAIDARADFIQQVLHVAIAAIELAGFLFKTGVTQQRADEIFHLCYVLMNTVELFFYLRIDRITGHG